MREEALSYKDSGDVFANGRAHVNGIENFLVRSGQKQTYQTSRYTKRINLPTLERNRVAF
jgi:hypothetical protein